MEKEQIKYNLVHGRRRGNTTRMADMFVQRFFETLEPIQIFDHYGSRKSSIRLMRIILERLKSEHNVQGDKVLFNESASTIQRNFKLLHE